MAESASDQKNFLGISLSRPRTAFFEFSSCEGCQLQLLNNEATLFPFLSLLDIVNFRETMTEKSDDYDIAIVEGSITRRDEVERLKHIRQNARVLVALGSCACFGGVNQLKNRFELDWVKNEVYGDSPIDTDKAEPLEAFVHVDHRIYGCPVRKEEVERIVTNLVIGKEILHPRYPVCMECKANENVCLYDLNEPCLGPITRAGCDSWCPSSRAGCWGCRGPADEPNLQQMLKIMHEKGFSEETITDRLECFGGFREFADKIRKG